MFTQNLSSQVQRFMRYRGNRKPRN